MLPDTRESIATRRNSRSSINVQPLVCRRILEACHQIRYGELDIELLEVAWRRARPGIRIRFHRHAFYEALLTVSGHGKECSRCNQRLIPGLVQLHVPGRRHAWEGGDVGLERFTFNFSLPSPFELRPIKQWPVIPEALDQLKDLVEETHTTSPGRADRIRARFILLAAHFFSLLDWSATQSEETLWTEASFSNIVNRHLEDNLDMPIGLPEIALFVGVSVPTLTRRYRAETGTSIIGYLNGLRLERAARLLTESDQAVASIAARTGFAEPSYFCNRFRARYDCTPLEYRGRAFSGQG